MMTVWAVLGGFVLDALFGDPAWLPHPVVYMGKAISKLEKFLRPRLPKTPQGELLGGAIVAFCLPVGTFLLTGLVCWGAARLHPLLGLAVQMFWCGQALAARGLVQESTNVYKELKKPDLPGARKAVSRIVGRDTAELTAEGVTKAAVETVAENASDGVIAPLLYMLIGGAPLALTYKAINTMDSMLGYKNEKYLYFGRVPAKLDDAANYLPSRLAALLWVAAAAFTHNDAKGAWKIWRRDRRRHASPNSAQTESACAGALGVQLAGPAYYFGRVLRQTDHRRCPAAHRAGGHPPGQPHDVRGQQLRTGVGMRPSRAFLKEAFMQTLTHGGDWMGYREQFGRDALDFSANVSPLGLPKGVADAITAALPQADRYPDPLCRTLRAALSEAEGLPADQILCGNGAADLIFRLALAVKPRRALVTAPTFAEYATALETVGCTVERFTLNEANDFAVTEEFLDAIVPGVEIVFLCQPNNPTGQLASPALVRRAAERCAACGAVLAVDECFLDFLPDGDRWTAKPLLHEDQNLIIFKAFTKLYGMAGVRLGYCLSADAALLEKMRNAGQPWAVSSLAQAAGVAALKETAYVARVRALIAAQKPKLTAGLRALGLRVIEGRANYLLLQGPETLGGQLRQKGVVLRGCANYPGLDASWYRTAVRTGPENERLLKTLQEVLG